MTVRASTAYSLIADLNTFLQLLTNNGRNEIVKYKESLYSQS